MIYIVGSGPAGVALAYALLAQNHHVTMLDVGVELEPDKDFILKQTRNTFIQTGKIDESLKSNLGDDLIKKVYNSDFIHSEISNHIKIVSDDYVQCMPSFAKGGLTNAWGAGVESFSDDYFSKWPISYNDIFSSYQSVFSLLGASVADTYHVQNRGIYRINRQAKLLLHTLSSSAEQLFDMGVTFTSSTIAANFAGCIYCGNCMYGCPLKLIYSSSQTVDDLLSNNKFVYISNIVVKSVEELDGHVVISGTDRGNSKSHTFNADRVYLACGALLSTWLILKSKKLYNIDATFLDSTHVTIPAIMFRRVKNISKDRIHTLFQLSIKISKKEISMKPIHLSIYTYMDLYKSKLEKMLGRWIFLLFFPILKMLLERIIIVKVHLSSEDSHAFSMSIRENESDTVFLKAKRNDKVDVVVEKLFNFMQAQKFKFGFLPVKMLMKVSKIGRSFHYGGSLPMSNEKGDFTTDIYGRVNGFRKLHVVDSAIFSSIPAGSVTATIMANAHRIGNSIGAYSGD